MLFSELFVQGVRCFSQMHRMPLAMGFTLFAGEKGAGKSTLVDLLVHLLYPDPTEPQTEVFRCKESPICRAALTIDDGRGQIYRLVKDLLRGSMLLNRLDPESGKPDKVTDSAAEIGQYLTGTLHLPQRDIYEGLYIFRARDFPSQAKALPRLDVSVAKKSPFSAPKGPTRGPARDEGPRFPGYQGGTSDGDGGDVLPDDPEEIRSQLAVLERDLRATRKVDEVQFQLDGLQSEMFEIDQKLKKVREAEARVKKTEELLSTFAEIEGLPGDFEARLASFETDRQRYERDLARVDEEKQAWVAKADGLAPAPLGRNRVFLIGLCGGLLAIVLGIIGFSKAEWMRWLALLDIPLFGAAMVAALRHVDAAMGFKHSQARLDALAERRQKIERQWEVEATIVRRLLSANRVESPAKLREVYKERAKALEARNTAQKALEAERQASRVDEIAARQREVGQQISALEAELGNAAGMMMSAQEMSRRIKALSEKLHRIESGGPARAQAPAAEPPSAPAGEDTSAEGAERCERLIKLAEDLFLVDAEQLAASLGPRMGQFLAALSGKRFTGLTFDTRGTVELTAAGGATVALAGLPLADLDLVFLAIRVALLEGFSKQQPLPVFLDDPFGHLPEPFIDLNGRLLASLGRATQVVLFSRHTEYSQHATASFAL